MPREWQKYTVHSVRTQTLISSLIVNQYTRELPEKRREVILREIVSD